MWYWANCPYCQRRVPQFHWNGRGLCKTDFSGNSSALTELDFDANNWVGQRYDGAANMSGHISGVQARIREKTPMAVYVHCASHCLNLVPNHSLQLPPVTNMFGTLSEVLNIFNDFPKHWHTDICLVFNLLTFWETRFIQRHDAILQFSNNFNDVANTLKEIAKSITMDAKTKAAASLMHAISRPAFLVSLAAAKKVMSLTTTFTTSSIAKARFVRRAEMVNGINNHLRDWCINDSAWLGGEFGIYAQAQQFACIGMELVEPTQTLISRSMHRCCPQLPFFPKKMSHEV